MGSHLIDLGMFLTGERIGLIQAHMDPVSFTRTRGDAPVAVSVSTFFSASGETEGGIHLHLSANASAFSGPAFDIDVFCEKGEVRFDVERKLRVFGQGGRVEDRTTETAPVLAEERANSVSIFRASFMYFAERIVKDIAAGRQGTEGACSFDEAVEVSRVLDAALTSYRAGHSVRVGAIGNWRGSF